MGREVKGWEGKGREGEGQGREGKGREWNLLEAGTLCIGIEIGNRSLQLLFTGR
jgi:hypothetical protein